MPGKVDELLVSEKGVSGERASGGEEQQEKNEDRTRVGGRIVTRLC